MNDGDNQDDDDMQQAKIFVALVAIFVFCIGFVLGNLVNYSSCMGYLR